MIYYIIPARKGSKGMLFKNRRLFSYTQKTIPMIAWESTIVTTDDKEIIKQGPEFNILKRSPELSSDEASMKNVLIDVIEKFDFNKDDIIVLLYLTYPERTWNDIQRGIDFFQAHKANSMLCRKEIKTNPYLCVYEDGRQVVKHNLYRRQDYPKVFEICHFLFIAKVSEIKKLNNNLYNLNTLYMDIPDKIDIDNLQDFLEFA